MTNEQKDKMIKAAYVLLCEFQVVIDDMLEGDHQHSRAVDSWLLAYEKDEQQQTKREDINASSNT